jgi:hypothetical protein
VIHLLSAEEDDQGFLATESAEITELDVFLSVFSVSSAAEKGANTQAEDCRIPDRSER